MKNHNSCKDMRVGAISFSMKITSSVVSKCFFIFYDEFEFFRWIKMKINVFQYHHFLLLLKKYLCLSIPSFLDDENNMFRFDIKSEPQFENFTHNAKTCV